MVPLRLEHRIETVPTRAPSEGAMAFINYLRFAAMDCRVKPRADLFEACALLHVTRTKSQEAHAEALMRCLTEALGKPARLHAPGTTEMTFDEAWLIQLGRATAQDDTGSINFLLHSRVVHQHRRLIRFLISHVSESFALN